MPWPMVAMAAVSVAGGIMGAAGKKKEAKAAKEAAEERERMAERRKEIAEENIVRIQQQTAFRLKQNNRENRVRLGAVRAAAGASGGRVNTGSVVDIVSDLTTQNELERSQIQFDQETKERAERHAGEGFQSDALLASMGGKAATTAGTFGAAASLLGGARGVLGSFGGGIGGL